MSGNKIPLVVVVNTEDVSVDANVNAPLQTVAQHALKNSESKDRPLSDFDFKDANGNPLDLSRKVGDFNFAAHAKLFLSLKVGIQG
jgi:DUF4097 and DUF4098 domain-containing protein YvlB